MAKQREGVPVHVSEDQVLPALFKVKPTADMPRLGAQRSGPKKPKRKPRRAK